MVKIISKPCEAEGESTSAKQARRPRQIRAFFIEALLFFWASACYAQTTIETENLNFLMSAYLRNDLVTFNNVVDLDNENKDDHSVYWGIDYNLGFNLDLKNSGQKFYLKLERNGPYDYDAPLFVHNTLMTSGGTIAKYRNEELLPELEEFWMDTPLTKPLRLKLGLYSYSVGNGFSLNGGYENLGFTISHESEDYNWNFYYCRPDFSHKFRLGPRIEQDRNQGILYEPNSANFFAVDAKFKIGEGLAQPYIGTLVDYTSSDKRANTFSAPVKRDILGTIGFAWEQGFDKMAFNFEAARNFGKAVSSDAEYKDIEHAGYLVYSGLEYDMGRFKPSVKFLACSGNKVTPEMAKNADETLTSGKNRAFSYASPTNMNLTDSISSSNVDMLPIVAMGGGYGLNYGIPRPKTFYSGDFENLLMPCIGFEMQATKKLDISIYEYYLSAFQRGVGTFEGEGKYLSRDLGLETDLFIDYQINENTLISLLAGYLLPGKFYKEQRDDTGGSLLTPFVRGDGSVNPAYQIELALELKF